jgi:hypothetical protein
LIASAEGEEDSMDYHFVIATGGSIPTGAPSHGNEADGTPLWVARSLVPEARFLMEPSHAGGGQMAIPFSWHAQSSTAVYTRSLALEFVQFL